MASLFLYKRTIITRPEQNYGRVTVGGTLPFVHFRICSRCIMANVQMRIFRKANTAAY